MPLITFIILIRQKTLTKIFINFNHNPWKWRVEGRIFFFEWDEFGDGETSRVVFDFKSRVLNYFSDNLLTSTLKQHQEGHWTESYFSSVNTLNLAHNVESRRFRYDFLSYPGHFMIFQKTNFQTYKRIIFLFANSCRTKPIIKFRPKFIALYTWLLLLKLLPRRTNQQKVPWFIPSFSIY